ncbi:MAG: nuclear transport factor 2 family protein [Actinomycetota bacterium]
MEHPNAELGRRFLQALDAKDFATVEGLVADDVVAHFPGSSQLSGTYEGRDQVFGVFAKGDELTGGTFERELHDVTASDDHIVILVSIRAQRDTKLITWNGANVWHVEDGKLTEVWLLSDDQAATDQAFA